jgi:Protein of unknown function (DUF3011)
MNSKKCLVYLGLVSLVGPLWAQDTMRAVLKGNGNGDSGKCTIEVNVDAVAEVEVSGDRARIHTLAGEPAQLRRFECSSIIPRNPNNFKFTGIDGRGQVTMVRDPRQTGGTAVIHIEDPKGGREGYTFDLEWQGGSGDYGYSRRDDSRNGPEYRDRDRNSSDRDRSYSDRDRGYSDRDRSYSDRDRGYSNGGYSDRGGDRVVVSCASNDGRRHYCQVDSGSGDIRLRRQVSEAACRRDDSWGVDRRGIWVDHGCAADFEVRR